MERPVHFHLLDDDAMTGYRLAPPDPSERRSTELGPIQQVNYVSRSPPDRL